MKNVFKIKWGKSNSQCSLFSFHGNIGNDVLISGGFSLSGYYGLFDERLRILFLLSNFGARVASFFFVFPYPRIGVLCLSVRALMTWMMLFCFLKRGESVRRVQYFNGVLSTTIIMRSIGAIVYLIMRVLLSTKNESRVSHFKRESIRLFASLRDWFFFPFLAGEFNEGLSFRSISIGRTNTRNKRGLIQVTTPCLRNDPSIVVIRLGRVLRAFKVIMRYLPTSIIMWGRFRNK